MGNTTTNGWLHRSFLSASMNVSSQVLHRLGSPFGIQVYNRPNPPIPAACQTARCKCQVECAEYQHERLSFFDLFLLPFIDGPWVKFLQFPRSPRCQCSLHGSEDNLISSMLHNQSAPRPAKKMYARARKTVNGAKVDIIADGWVQMKAVAGSSTASFKIFMGQLNANTAGTTKR